MLVPPPMVSLAKTDLVDQYDTSSLRTVLAGAAPVHGHVADRLVERFRLRQFSQCESDACIEFVSTRYSVSALLDVDTVRNCVQCLA